MKRNERTYQQWKDLAERYFEAETTPEEEKELACFLATPHRAKISKSSVPLWALWQWDAQHIVNDKFTHSAMPLQQL
jgi:hypothetical protein